MCSDEDKFCCLFQAVDRNFVKLNSAVRRYLLYTLPTGATAGLVKYSSDSTDISGGMQPVVTQSDRDYLANRVPLEKRGGTAIGKGLRRAERVMFTSYYSNTHVIGWGHLLPSSRQQ